MSTQARGLVTASPKHSKPDKNHKNEPKPGTELAVLLEALQRVKDGDFSVRMPSDLTGLVIVRANEKQALTGNGIGVHRNDGDPRCYRCVNVLR